jgi:hypothetical protein
MQTNDRMSNNIQFLTLNIDRNNLKANICNIILLRNIPLVISVTMTMPNVLLPLTAFVEYFVILDISSVDLALLSS